MNYLGISCLRKVRGKVEYFFESHLMVRREKNGNFNKEVFQTRDFLLIDS
jgi:hypothetical protein